MTALFGDTALIPKGFLTSMSIPLFLFFKSCRAPPVKRVLYNYQQISFTGGLSLLCGKKISDGTIQFGCTILDPFFNGIRDSSEIGFVILVKNTELIQCTDPRMLVHQRRKISIDDHSVKK